MESLSSRTGTRIRRIAGLAAVILCCTAAVPASACDDAEAAEAAKTAESADPVVCRKIAVTGSRLRKGEVCRPRSVWEKHEQRAKDFLKDVDRRNSTGPQDFPPPG